MLELEIGGQRYPVPTGELVIGSDPSSAISLSGAAVRPRHLIVAGAADGSVSVRPAAPDAEVLLNGVRLGAEPAPLLHGDKIQVGAQELLVTDPRRSGSTQFVSTADLARMVGAPKAGAAPRAATAASGGRLVCLTDGREYSIGSEAIVFGREAGCDIVIPNKDVSRRHAEILATPQGYVLVDSSTNGTFVNGERIEGQRILARADVIRIGDHDFRFYADAAPPPSAEPAAPMHPPTPQFIEQTPFPPPPASPPTPPAGASARLSETMHGIAVGGLPPQAVTPRPSSSAGSLASFLLRTGQLKGKRLHVRVPVVNIGRAEYNDLVIPDDSVSTMHAKLQRREHVWVLTDNGSTNGTFVDGERVSGEALLGPGASVRFGEVSALFEPTDDQAGVNQGAGTKVLSSMAPPPPAPAAPAPPAPPKPTPGDRPARKPVVVASPPAKRGIPGWVIPVLVVVGIIAAIILLR